jgi:hypothetical protein
VAILATRSTQCVSPLEDVTLRVDLRSTKRAPARLSDISFVSAGCAPRAKSVVFASCVAGKYKYSALLRLALRALRYAVPAARKPWVVIPWLPVRRMRRTRVRGVQVGLLPT